MDIDSIDDCVIVGNKDTLYTSLICVRCKEDYVDPVCITTNY